jgi:hypothetical protein
MNIKRCFQLSVLASALALGGCGGSSPPPVVESSVPDVSIDDVTVDEKSTVSITADVDTKTDTVDSYSWTVTSDSYIELTGADTATLSFTAPEVSADSTIDLSLTVTDSDGDSTTATSTVSVSQLTIPLTITGLATDSPIADAQITVRIAGRDVTVDVTADSTGAYTVNLLLDDTEEAAFISIEARGVGEQAAAGLISLLGTAGQLSDQAGDDGELTSDENFAVNVTNVTTARYALAKSANNGEDITSDEQLADISERLNYDDVMTLATAIKVAIDKATENADLALPAEIPDTLALVEAIVDAAVEATDETEVAQAYIQDVQNEPEFEEAQEEIFEDENLVDTSGYVVPFTYYLLPPRELTSGTIFYFNEDGTGSGIETTFTWQEANAFISIINTAYETYDYVDYFDIDGDEVDYEVEVQSHTSGYQLRRLSSNDTGEVIALTTNTVVHYPNGELNDVVSSETFTHYALRDAGVKSINLDGVTTAYLTTGWPEQVGDIEVSADKFTFNENGTGSTELHDQDFTWQISEGALNVIYPEEEALATYKLLSEQGGTDFFANEEVEANETYAIMVGEGKISSEYPQWSAENAIGIYVYENLPFDDPNDQFWFELHENGDAETYATYDYNEDGILTSDEVSTMYGQWHIDESGYLVITRFRLRREYDWGVHFGEYSESCRSAETEGCILYHTRTWRLIGKTDEQFGLFHKHDFKWSVFEGETDYITYDIHTLFKKDKAPVDISSLSEPAEKPARAAKGIAVKVGDEGKISNKYEKLEPSI